MGYGEADLGILRIGFMLATVTSVVALAFVCWPLLIGYEVRMEDCFLVMSLAQKKSA